MARTSGSSILPVNNTWTGTETFNANILFNAFQQVNSSVAFTQSAIKTTTATLTTGNLVVLCDTTTAAFTLSLPASPNAWQVYYIKQINSANALTIAGNGHNIEGATTLVFTAQNEAVMLLYDNTNAQWRVMAANAGAVV